MYSNNIKHYRKEKGLTLEKLSFMTGLSIGYLSHLQNGGRSNPSYETMKKISLALNKDISEIFI